MKHMKFGGVKGRGKVTLFTVTSLEFWLQTKSNCCNQGNLLTNWLSFFCRPSPILLALDIEETVARRAIRLSVGRETTQEDIDKAVNDLKQAVEKIQNRNGGLSPQFIEY